MSEQRSGRQTIADISELKVKPTGGAIGKVADHLSGWVNVRSYGAKGDGVTDDYAALLAMVTALGSTAATLIVPGPCVVGTNLTIPSNLPVRFLGAGAFTGAGVVTYTGEPANAATLAATANAEAAQVAAELARDAANATGKVYPDTTAGVAAVAEGEYFSVPSAGSSESLILYRRSGAAAVEAKRYPTADAVFKPKWVGKKGGWPDPFFWFFDLSSQTFLGRDRWWWNGNGAGAFTGWSRVANSAFDGFALRRAADSGTGVKSFPVIWLDEIGAVAGDTITVYTLITGAGAVVSCAGWFDNGADAGYVGDQLNATDATGAATMSASATPQWMRHVVTVPTTATRFAPFPFTLTAGQTFDVVALWAFKGNAAAGPDWPMLGDEAFLSDLTTQNATQNEQLEYVLDTHGIVTSSAETIALNVTGVVAAALHGDPFTGWGERYTPAGVSFNAVRVRSITRTTTYTDATKWATLRVVVRTGANSQNAGAAVVAVGSARVAPNADTLNDVTILLRDPTTNALKTLTDANFTGGEYFIGVYARNTDGGGAAMSEHIATQPNTLSTKHYLTTANPLTGNWSLASGSDHVGVQHLMLTDPVEGVSYAASTALREEIQASGGAPSLVLPPTVYFTQGREGAIYFDNLLPEAASEYLFDVTAGPSTAVQQNERVKLSPSGAIASTATTIKVYEKRSGVEVATGSTNVVAAALAAGTGSTPKCIFIGDSLTNAAIYTGELLNIATPDALKVALYGTRGTGLNLHEGRGGWTIANYTSNFSDGSGANPFWNTGTGAVDFPNYLTANAIPVPDWVFVMLGINDVFNAASDVEAVSLAQAAFVKLDTLIASIKAAGASVKVAVMTPTPPSAEQDAFGASYGVAQSRWRFKRNVVLWAKELIARYSGQTASRIYIVPTHVNLDTVNNMSRAAAAPVNSRSTVQVARQNNGVHPATEGYNQIADTVWAFLKNNV
jgi:lysophospholipase L1-like esterase